MINKISKRTLIIKAVLIVLALMFLFPVFMVAFLPLFDKPVDTSPAPHIFVMEQDRFYRSLGLALILFIPGGALLVSGVWFGSGIPYNQWALGRNPLLSSVLFLIVGMGGLLLGAEASRPLWVGMSCGGLFGSLIGWVVYVLEHNWGTK